MAGLKYGLLFFIENRRIASYGNSIIFLQLVVPLAAARHLEIFVNCAGFYEKTCNVKYQ